jgi:hypothetical protein
MSLTTRPPGADLPVRTPEPAVPAQSLQLRSLIDEVRALALQRLGADGRGLPPLPEARGASLDAVLLRWANATLEGGTLSSPLLKTLIVDATARLVASLGRPGGAPATQAATLEVARDALLRVLGETPPQPGEPAVAAPPTTRTPSAGYEPAPAVRVLVDEVRRAVVEAIRAEPPFVAAPVVGEEPGNAGAALLGWLRTAAAAAGVAPGALEVPVATGARRADELLGAAVRDPAVSAALQSVRDVVSRGLGPATPASAERVALLRGLVAAVQTAVLARAPNATPLPPLGRPDDFQHVGATVAAWVRATAGAAGVAPSELESLVAGGLTVALEQAPEALKNPQSRVDLGLLQAALVRGLGAEGGGSGAAVLLTEGPIAAALAAAGVRAERALALSAGGRRPRIDSARRGSRDRVDAIGEDARRSGQGAGEPEPGPGAQVGADADRGRTAGALEGPMQCIRRCFEAFHAGDGPAYAGLFVYPTGQWRDGRWSGYGDAAACVSGQGEALRALQAAGVAGGRILMLRVEPLGDDVASVHAVLTDERSDQSVLREYEAVYTTVRTETGWRIAMSILK